ncbi:thiamine-phosphate kinase [Allorhodopirellula heiligendammensis]|uniref:Thiamine-monophosphate kinase n=1 Tax=Allorhodopirellula heiligendammensis TaxID=2714739 RepID=A0A5C6BIA0_9BACT|nr:thiamine-phosphate kinase [Allorhodopirellula heiligendammensis]TWU11046.1 Thiamine-monophosphate kinase [Allorhodopirellula heiligendammensis]
MEQSFLAYLRGRTRSLPAVAVGIGDDAAVMDLPAGDAGIQQVACTDQIIDGVDFDSQSQPLASIGYKSIAINLSDIAAMGAAPTAALVTLALPADNATEIAGEVYEGILEACGQFGIAIAGGDLSTYDGPLAISVCLLGTVTDPWLRSGAAEGDVIFVTGSLGGSLLGRHLRPTPRVEFAKRLRQHAQVHAAIDVSDGFSLDLDRLLAASRVGAELDLECIPISDAAVKMSADSGRTPLQHAWSDGEDFELIFTVSESDAASIEKLSADELTVEITRVGTVVGRTGLWKRITGSKLERVFPQGYVHGETDA